MTHGSRSCRKKTKQSFARCGSSTVFLVLWWQLWEPTWGQLHSLNILNVSLTIFVWKKCENVETEGGKRKCLVVRARVDFRNGRPRRWRRRPSSITSNMCDARTSTRRKYSFTYVCVRRARKKKDSFRDAFAIIVRGKEGRGSSHQYNLLPPKISLDAHFLIVFQPPLPPSHTQETFVFNVKKPRASESSKRIKRELGDEKKACGKKPER